MSQDEFQSFARDDLDIPKVRYFCDTCGTHVCVESQTWLGMLVLKVGKLDIHMV